MRAINSLQVLLERIGPVFRESFYRNEDKQQFSDVARTGQLRIEDVCVTHILRTGKVEIRPGQRWRVRGDTLLLSDTFSCSGSHPEVLERDDMISCPKSIIEGKKNLGTEVELQTQF